MQRRLPRVSELRPVLGLAPPPVTTAQRLAAAAHGIAVWLRRQLASGASDMPEDTAARRLAKRYAQAITRDFRTPRLMGDYAEALDVTPTHLTRVCRQCCGKTAADMLTERKLHAARSALEAPKPSVQEIAASLGFGSPAYFTRFIQSHTGHTPTALRSAAAKRQARL